jgi:hypothetical protein
LSNLIGSGEGGYNSFNRGVLAIPSIRRRST